MIVLIILYLITSSFRTTLITFKEREGEMEGERGDEERARERQSFSSLKE